ncbi:fatty acid desaturase [Ningiella sp. W23]|uniref:fatty acid desaturase n=1 Tax=Ningiella sp. W23 TaxID=3023715 RepID=UPI003757FFFF
MADQSDSQNARYVQAQDYSLTGENSRQAIESGLADAHWYTSKIAPNVMRELLVRKDAPAIRDTAIWFGALGLSGYLGYLLWGTIFAIIPFAIYGVLYASVSDSRWHESSHGTAFKTDWLNDALYEIASFMVFRESTVWRWSHTRHHTDTIIVGRDPEIAVPRPANIRSVVLAFFKFEAAWAELKRMLIHAQGKKSEQAATFVPEQEWPKVFLKARIYLCIYASVIFYAAYSASWLPLMYVGLPSIYGSWLMVVYGLTQHTGLAENVTDHRLNSRTVYMNALNRYLYWNMNYHVEHHMFPLVPYHALPRLHEYMKEDCPKPYEGLWDAWKEIIPAVIKQSDDPDYFVTRELPASAQSHDPSANANLGRGNAKIIQSSNALDKHGWLALGARDLLEPEHVIGLEYDHATYAIYRSKNGELYATDGICTHGNTHLANGMVKGELIECPKHNGRFNIVTGEATRLPACQALKTYPVKLEADTIYINLKDAAKNHALNALQFEVISNRNLTPLIKELVLRPLSVSPEFSYRPGDYIQLNIPAYDAIHFSDLEIDEEYQRVWNDMALSELVASNTVATKRNYSLASNPDAGEQPSFTIRLAPPPANSNFLPGVGSAYVFNLKPGDKVTASAPAGQFYIKDSNKEMIYIGGGAGMAPMRAHISHLFGANKKQLATQRRVSFWYGARSEQDLMYQDYFAELEQKHDNFDFHIALSEQSTSSDKAYATGFIHSYLLDSYLAEHKNIQNIEFYICGPPPMLKACLKVLEDLNVSKSHISFDDFG